MKVIKVTSKTGVIDNPSASQLLIERKQIHLHSKPIKKTKEFLRALWEADIKDSRKIFDKLDCNVSIRRMIDPDMDLDKFLMGLTRKNIFAVLQAGSPVEEEIVVGVSYDVRNPQNHSLVTHFLWFICPLNRENYNAVEEIFQKTYQTGM